MASDEPLSDNDNETLKKFENGKWLLKVIVLMRRLGTVLRSQMVIPSSVAATNRLLENATELRLLGNVCSIALLVDPFLPFQTLTVLSDDPDASYSPLGENASAITFPE